MHPILFRIPLPHWNVPVGILALVVAGLVLAFAVRGFFAAKKQGEPPVGAGILGAIAIALVAFKFVYLKSHPELETFELGPIPIYSYGVMLGLSLVVGWYVTLTLAERDGLPKETMANCYVVTAIAAVVGSR